MLGHALYVKASGLDAAVDVPCLGMLCLGMLQSFYVKSILMDLLAVFKSQSPDLLLLQAIAPQKVGYASDSVCVGGGGEEYTHTVQLNVIEIMLLAMTGAWLGVGGGGGQSIV